MATAAGIWWRWTPNKRLLNQTGSVAETGDCWPVKINQATNELKRSYCDTELSVAQQHLQQFSSPSPSRFDGIKLPEVASPPTLFRKKINPVQELSFSLESSSKRGKAVADLASALGPCLEHAADDQQLPWESFKQSLSKMPSVESAKYLTQSPRSSLVFMSIVQQVSQTTLGDSLSLMVCGPDQYITEILFPELTFENIQALFNSMVGVEKIVCFSMHDILLQIAFAMNQTSANAMERIVEAMRPSGQAPAGLLESYFVDLKIAAWICVSFYISV